MENFTPWSALIGGGMIGLSAMILINGLGRIAGIAGIIGGMRADRQELPWRGSFIIGLVLGSMLCMAGSAAPLEITIDANLPTIVAGGCWPVSGLALAAAVPAVTASAALPGSRPARWWRRLCLWRQQHWSSSSPGTSFRKA